MSTATLRLNVLSFGAGAIGTYIGGSLAMSGQRVVFLERPEAAQALRPRGLRLQLADGEHLLPEVEVAASLEEALGRAPFDVALFALKSYDTEAALQGLRPYADALPPVLCLQNGVDNEPQLAAVLGAQNVIPGSVTSAIGRGGVGEIRLERLRGMGLAAGHPLSARLAQTLETAGMRPRLYARADAMKWSKLLTNLVGNATSAILDMPPAEIFAHPGLFRLEMEQLRETLRVMSALGARVVDLPGTPVRLLALGARLPAALSRRLMIQAVGGGRGGKMPSFHIDLHSGRGQSEVEYLNGAVARHGERNGVPAPVNRLLTETLLKLTRGELAMSEYARRPERLLKEWANQGGLDAD